MKKRAIHYQYPNLMSLLHLVEKTKKVGWFHADAYNEHFRQSAGSAMDACILDERPQQVNALLIDFEKVLDEMVFVRISTSIISALFLAAKPTSLVKDAYKEFLHAVDHHAPNSMETPIRDLLDARINGVEWFLTEPSLGFWHKFQNILLPAEQEQHKNWEISKGDYVTTTSEIRQLLKRWRTKGGSGYQSLLVKGVRQQRHKEIWLRTAFELYGIGTFVDKAYSGNRFSLRPKHVAWMTAQQKTFLKECEFIPALRDKERWLEWHNVLCPIFDLEAYFFYQRAEQYYNLCDMPFYEEYQTVRSNQEVLHISPAEYFNNAPTVSENEVLLHF